MTKAEQGSPSKNIAIINSKAPFSSSHGKDALDLALIFGSYEQSVSLFFQGDGVWQLIAGQNAGLINNKDYLKTFAALTFYDIEQVFVCQNSLQLRGLDNRDFLIENIVKLAPKEFAEQLQHNQVIFRF